MPIRILVSHPAGEGEQQDPVLPLGAALVSRNGDVFLVELPEELLGQVDYDWVDEPRPGGVILGRWTVAWAGDELVLSHPSGIYPGSLGGGPDLTGRPGRQVLKLKAPPTVDAVRALDQAGYDVLGPVGYDGVHVRARYKGVEPPDCVDYGVPYYPEMRLHRVLLDTLAGLQEEVEIGPLLVVVDPPNEEEKVRRRVRELGGTVMSDRPVNYYRTASAQDAGAPRGGPASMRVRGRFTVRLPLANLGALVQEEAVSWVQPLGRHPAPEGEIDNLVLAGQWAPASSGKGSGGDSLDYRGWLGELGLSGAETVLAVCDSGVDVNRNNNDQARADLRGRQEDAVDYTGGAELVDLDGHGTSIAGVAVGGGLTDAREPFPVPPPNPKKARSYGMSMGVAPEARFLALNPLALPSELADGSAAPGSVVVPWWPPTDLTQYAHDALDRGAEVMVCAWTTDPSTAAKGYTEFCRQVDALVRDPSGDHLPQNGLITVWSAGNHGAGAWEGSLTEPKEAKNGIVVGACHSGRVVAPKSVDDDDPKDVAWFSARGPTSDGRISPHVVAPGVTVTSIASGRASDDEADVDGDVRLVQFDTQRDYLLLPLGVDFPGRTPIDRSERGTTYEAHRRDRKLGAHDPNALLAPLGAYRARSGTSYAAAQVAGAALLVVEWWRALRGVDPSPALVKALLINSADDLAALGGEISDPYTSGVPELQKVPPIPNGIQGWGRVNLSNLFLQRANGTGAGADALRADRGPRLMFDHEVVAPGQRTWKRTIAPEEPGLPLRITLAWTDAPGAVDAPTALVNDLDLEVVEVDKDGNAVGPPWRGNVFEGGWSRPGGKPDRQDNVECVYLREPTGLYEVRVRGTFLRADARPPYGMDAPWQDFALVMENAREHRGGAVFTDVLDVSGSMATVGMDRGMRAALGRLLAHQRPTDRNTLVKFDHQAKRVGTRKVESSAEAREATRFLLDTLEEPDGGTNLDAALQLTSVHLEPGTERVVLWTDGWSPGAAKALPARLKATPVHVVIPGPTANLPLLARYGTLSPEPAKGGIAGPPTLHYAPTPAHLALATTGLRATLLGEEVVLNRRLVLGAAESSVSRADTALSTTVGAWIESGVESATFTVTWLPEGPPEGRQATREANRAVEVFLHDPRGVRLPRACSAMRRIAGAAQVIIQVPEPREGRWAIEVASRSRFEQAVTVTVTVKSRLRVRGAVLRTDQGLEVRVKSSAPPVAAEAVVERPFATSTLPGKVRKELLGNSATQPGDGAPAAVVSLAEGRRALLADRGFDVFEPVLDTLAFERVPGTRDQVLGIYRNLELAGMYTFDVHAWGWDPNGARYQRALRLTTFVPEGTGEEAESFEVPERPAENNAAFVTCGEQMDPDDLGITGTTVHTVQPSSVLQDITAGGVFLKVMDGSTLIGSVQVVGGGSAPFGLSPSTSGGFAIDKVEGVALGNEAWRFAATESPSSSFDLVFTASKPTLHGGTVVEVAFPGLPSSNTNRTIPLATGSQTLFKLERVGVTPSPFGYVLIDKSSDAQTWFIRSGSPVLVTIGNVRTISINTAQPIKALKVTSPVNDDGTQAKDWAVVSF